MATVVLTAPPTGVYQWRTPYRLGNVAGAVEWRWNEPGQMWSIRLSSSAGVPLAGPIPLATGRDLLAQWRHFDLPPGTLTVESAESVPGADAFGNSARLVYTTA
jgi:hypothetical protein